MKKNMLNYFCVLLLALLFVGCKPDQVGYLNDNLRYGVAELQAVQGSAVTTNPLIANGSTAPMTVKLLAVRNKLTGEVIPDFLAEHEFSVYLGQVGNGVTTLEQLNALIGTSKAPGLSVNQAGGKVVLTPATENVPAGLYTLDLQVSNISGAKVYNEVLDINLIPLKADTLYSSSATSTSLFSESNPTLLPTQQYTVNIQHIPTGDNKIILMWIDKNGKPFNPKTGEVIRRTSLPSFADWSPFYAEELTDTALVYPYPYFKGIPYPVKTSTAVANTSYTDFGFNYRVKGDYNELRRNLNTVSRARFFKPGTHIVRYRFKDLAHKPPVLHRTTIDKEVILPIDAPDYEGTPISLESAPLLSGLKIATLGEFNTKFAAGEISFNVLQTDNTRNPLSTAAAPGMWLDADGNTTNWGSNSRFYSEFKRTDMQLSVGLFPGVNAAGNTFTYRQSFVAMDSNGDTNEVVYRVTVRVQ